MPAKRGHNQRPRVIGSRPNPVSTVDITWEARTGKPSRSPVPRPRVIELTGIETCEAWKGFGYTFRLVALGENGYLVGGHSPDAERFGYVEDTGNATWVAMVGERRVGTIDYRSAEYTARALIRERYPSITISL